MSDHQAQYPIATMCLLLGVSSSGYYAWAQHQPSRRSQSDAALVAEIRAAHAGLRGIYGGHHAFMPSWLPRVFVLAANVSRG